MEFYSPTSISSGAASSFNSQRDGILRDRYGVAVSIYLFQFPTGWNSTMSKFSWTIIGSVSIPNGMEFYKIEISLPYRALKFQFPTGWNSTGIFASIASLVSSFQFPTGWNSTLAAELVRDGAKLFQFPTGWNSTDECKKFFRRWKKFQFPTGWNSTVADGLSRTARYVSIPNGMEFYLTADTKKINRPCFNSQRDGILPKCQNIWISSYLFQFPTGWNSTSSWARKNIFHSQFQFPTGWNSTVASYGIRSVSFAFQFPTGWNSTEALAKNIADECRFNSQRDGILL